MGTIIGIWTAHYLSPDDASLMWAHSAWQAYADFGSTRSRRQHNVERLVAIAQALSALPIQDNIPSYNVHEQLTGAIRASKDAVVDPEIKQLLKYAVRPARAYVLEWLAAMRALKLGLDTDVQEAIWRLLNTMLSTVDISTLKMTLPSHKPECPRAYSNHILALLWELLVVENPCLRGVADLFMCELVSPNTQLTERLPLLYVTCMYRPLFVTLLSQLEGAGQPSRALEQSARALALDQPSRALAIEKKGPPPKVRVSKAGGGTGAGDGHGHGDEDECWYLFAPVPVKNDSPPQPVNVENGVAYQCQSSDQDPQRRPLAEQEAGPRELTCGYS
jgi:hypothetical protein